MKIVVTGAAGFIGSHFCERLLQCGHEVVGIDNYDAYYSAALKKLNADYVVSKGGVIHNIDLSQGNYAALLQGANVVIHLAGQPGLSSKVPFGDYLKNNVIATSVLLEEIEKLEEAPKFINICTSSVYGDYATEGELTPPTPTSFYGVTKLCAEQLVLSACRSKALPAISCRIFSVYGERERPEKFFPLLINSIFNQLECPLYEGSLEHARSFTHVSDIVSGVLSALDHFDDCVGEIFNLGSPSVFKIREAVDLIEALTGKKARFRMLPPRAGDQISTCAKIDKANQAFGYKPSTTLREGLEKEVHWFRTHPTPAAA